MKTKDLQPGDLLCFKTPGMRCLITLLVEVLLSDTKEVHTLELIIVDSTGYWSPGRMARYTYDAHLTLASQRMMLLNKR